MNVLDETELDTDRLKDKQPHVLKKLNLSQNLLTSD